MKRKVKLTESELVNLIERTIEEQSNSENLNEGSAAKKPKPMKSRRSGIKTQKRINQNHEILKKFKS